MGLRLNSIEFWMVIVSGICVHARAWLFMLSWTRRRRRRRDTKHVCFCFVNHNQINTLLALSLSELLLRQHKKHLPVCVVLNIHVIVLTFARADMPDMVSKFFISPRVFFCRHHEPHTFIVDVGFSLVALQVISFLFFNQVRLDVIECLGLWMCVVFYVGGCLSGEMS